MITLLAVLAVLAVVFGVAVVLTGRAAVLSDEGQDLAATGIPRHRAMTPQDVIGLRFALAFRGYRMSEVDDALDRLAAEIAARDEALERLRGGGAPAASAEAAAAEADAEVGAPWATDEQSVWGRPDVASPDLPPLPPVLAAPPAPPAPEPPAPEPTPAEPQAAEPEAAAEPAAPPVDAATAAFEAVLAGGTRTGAPQPPDDPGDNPFRPAVPEIPTYDPWAVTPRSRYTDGPEYVEVEHEDGPDEVEVTEHQTGYALPPPAPGDDDE